ncbi:Transcription initiation factor IIE subunit beta-like protein [Drosera capensis]
MGSLKEELARFQKQQEKCHNMVANITAKQQAASNRSSAASGSSGAINGNAPSRPPVPQIKFSSDTDRLQHINSIRKAPVGAQIKKVIDLLFEKRQAFTPEQINEATYVDMNANKAVFESLRNNPKVHYDGRRFSYKSKHDVKNKDELLKLIRKFTEGILIVDLKDAYPNVMEDLQALKAEGTIWLLSNFDSHEDIAYPNDPRLLGIKVDDDLKQLFRSIDLPRDMLDVEKDLQKNGFKPATNTAKRRAAAQIQGISPKSKPKKKNREITKRTKLTNTHMRDLLFGGST